MPQVLIGIIALALVAGAFAVTGFVLVNGGLTTRNVPSYAVFENCGQGLRVRGDVKLRGVLVGLIEEIERVQGADCKVTLGIFPESQQDIPANVGAQIRAKTIFGEKWVELLYPQEPVEARLAEDQVIPKEETIDPIEVETLLNTALPLLESIDPEDLAATFNALVTGFVGHEDAAIRSMKSGIKALKPLNENEALFNEGITQLEETSETLQNVDDDLFAAMDRLDAIQRFTVEKEDLIAANFEKVPRLLDELSLLFNTRFADITKLVNRGATIIDLLAARREDLDKLLDILPKFNSAWIRNLNHNCRFRQATDEPGKEVGDRVPGRCWRVHNIISESQGAYKPGEGPKPHDGGGDDDGGGARAVSDRDLEKIGIGAESDLGRVLGTPAVAGGGSE